MMNLMLFPIKIILLVVILALALIHVGMADSLMKFLDSKMNDNE
jgi:hypothetical protein